MSFSFYVYIVAAFGLILIGLAAVLLRKNLIKIILGFSLMGTGSHILIVVLGMIPGGGSAPIIDRASLLQSGDTQALLVQAGAVVDPVPQAMVLTAIVIGVGVTALMLAYVVRIYGQYGTLDVNALARLKW